MPENPSRFPSSRRLAGWIVVLVACVLPGCGGGGVKLAPVEGDVSLDGKPVPGGRLTFIPDAGQANPPSFRVFGNTDRQGHYRVESDHGRGAPVGAYRVVVLSPLPTADMPKDLEPIPPIYQDENRTPLKVVVSEGAPAHAYDLQLKK